MSIYGIAENIVADFLFLFIVTAIGWIYLVLSRRTKLLKFFGVADSHRIVIYLSNLRIQEGGALGIDDQPRSYEGSAAAFGEIISANRFRDLFNYILPSLSDKPGILSKLLISDVQVQLVQSPLNLAQIERASSFLTMGSPAYNIASRFVEDSLRSKAKFRLGRIDRGGPSTAPSKISNLSLPVTDSSVAETHIFGPSASPALIPPSPKPSGLNVNAHLNSQSLLSVSTGSEPNVESSAILVEGIPHMPDSTLGFVERIVDPERKRCIFYVAGISELATAGAANFLMSKWLQLHSKYGSETNFMVMLRFAPSDYRHWIIVFEK